MPWQCFLIKSIRKWTHETDTAFGVVYQRLFELADGRLVTLDELPVGAMWHSSIDPIWITSEPTLYVILPGHFAWPMNHGGSKGARWNVVGTPPEVSATPSIRITGGYHGYVGSNGVQPGVVSDDVDGKRYSQAGDPL